MIPIPKIIPLFIVIHHSIYPPCPQMETLSNLLKTVT